jgi:hypothetical protein
LIVKTLSRAHRAARMTVMGFKDERIAAAIGLTPAGLAQLKQRQEYKDIEQEVLTGSITAFDEAIASNSNDLINEFKVGVPLAMRALIDNVMQRKDLKAQLEAAKELLDRDPEHTFSKETRAPGPANGPQLPQNVVDGLTKSADEVAAEITPKVVVN